MPDDAFRGASWLPSYSPSRYVDYAPSTGVEGYTFANAEAAALVARFTNAPTNARKALIDALVGSLKTAGVWAKLDALYVFAAADAQAARQNWIQDLYNCTAVSSPTFAADRGYTPDGSASYLDTNFNPTTAVSPKFTQDSAAMGLWSRTNLANGAGTSFDFGAAGVSYIARDSAVSGRATGRINTAVGGKIIGNSAYPGFMAWSRTAAAVWTGYSAGASSNSGTDASSAPTNNNFGIGRTVAGSFGLNQIAGALFGASLSGTEELAAYNALQTYMTAVGA